MQFFLVAVTPTITPTLFATRIVMKNSFFLWTGLPTMTDDYDIRVLAVATKAVVIRTYYK